jgi:protein-tyrosine phosphatase
MLGVRTRLQRSAERAALAIGCFGAESVDWQRVQRVVFVCTGNICRSPFAEAFARGRGLTALSCGIDTRTDFPADPMAIAEAARRGVDLNPHRTTRWLEMKLEPTDLVIATQLRHALAVRKRARAAGCRTIVMSSLLLPDFQVVSDPYGRDTQAFVTAFDQIEKAIARIMALSACT